MKNPFPHWVWWLLAAAICFTMAVAVSGQPAEPTPDPLATALRDAADRAQTLADDQRFTYGKLQAEELENARLRKLLDTAILVWKPGMAIDAGRTYQLPAEPTPLANVIIRVPVTFVGGWVYPSEKTPAFKVVAGGKLTLVNTKFDHPDPPRDAGNPNKLGIGFCVETESPDGVSLINPTFGRVDVGVRTRPGSKRTLVAGFEHGALMTSELVGAFGGDEVAVLFGRGRYAGTENVIRFSPQGQDVPRKVLVAFNQMDRAGTKSIIDLRQLRGGIAAWNRLNAADDHAAIGIGNADLAEPGARDVYVIGNEILGGTITAYNATDRLVIDGNVPLNWNQGVNNFMSINAAGGVMQDVRVTNNAGALSGGKPLLSWTRGVRPARVDERGNGWSVPTTQPTTRPVQ